MAKTPKLSKELKNSGKKARKCFVKAYEKSLKKQGDKKKAYRKAYEKLALDFELKGKKWVAKSPDAALTKSAKIESAKTKTKKQGKKKKKPTEEFVDLEASLPDAPISELEELPEPTNQQEADALAGEVLETSAEDSVQNYTRVQLYRLAQELKIAGRSSMNKDQLFIAVKEAQQV